MIFVPNGATAVYQPLDRRIYAVMKSKARAKYDRAISNGECEPVMKESAEKLVAECWIEPTKENITSAWVIEGIESEDGRHALGSENDDIVSEGRSGPIECDIEYGHEYINMEDIRQSKKGPATIMKTTSNKRS
jgi:hypothetical protein